MDYLQNHCWCSHSHWDGSHYDCRHLVSISKYKEYAKVDFGNVVESVPYVARPLLHQPDYEVTTTVARLRPNVVAWLVANVKDRNDVASPRGWCVGNDEYNYHDGGSFSIFFHRKTDAMRFIAEFSQYKKPVSYCQYFLDVRKDLNLTTLKYELRK